MAQQTAPTERTTPKFWSWAGVRQGVARALMVFGLFEVLRLSVEAFFR